MCDSPTANAAEVMGWTPFGERWIHPNSESPSDVSCDDMLAWLQARGCDVRIDTYRRWDDVLLSVRGEVGAEVEVIAARSLHAALEQVVIAIGRAGVEPT